jgi:hypothetical protein
MHIVGTWELGTLIYLISCHEKTNSTPVHWPINGRNRRLSGLPPYGDMLPYYHVAPCSWTLKTRLPLEADSRDNTWPHACGHSGLTCHSRPLSHSGLTSLPRQAPVSPHGFLPVTALRTHLLVEADSDAPTWLYARDRSGPASLLTFRTHFCAEANSRASTWLCARDYWEPASLPR